MLHPTSIPIPPARRSGRRDQPWAGITRLVFLALALSPSGTLLAQTSPGPAIVLDNPDVLAPQAGSGWGGALAASDANPHLLHDELLVGASGWSQGSEYPDSGLYVLFSNASHHQPVTVLAPFFAPAGSECGTRVAFAEIVPGEVHFFSACPRADTGNPPVVEAGWVTRRYGGGAVSIDQEFANLGSNEPMDHFGEALAVGDFNGDGREDIAIGAPGENLEQPIVPDRGAVYVFSFPATGAEGIVLTPPTAVSGRFGSALAAGDFDGDGFDDLAVGEPSTLIDEQAKVGTVRIFYGSASGLSQSPTQTLNPGDFGLASTAALEFGAGLAAGDFDQSLQCAISSTCRDDLAIGIPGYDSAEGAVVVASGTGSGLSTVGAPFLQQDDIGLGQFNAQFDERFGEVLYAGELNGLLGIDLAGGVPDDRLNSLAERGLVHLVFGGPGGLQSSPGETLSYSSLTGEPIQAGDRFGAAFTAGQFDSAPGIDYAIGAPGFDLPGAADAGRVVLVYRDPLFADGFESGDLTAWTSAP